MGLCPGVYNGPQSVEESVNVAESAFYFLEAAIANNRAKYTRSYAHWGVTAISAEEWSGILSDWATLQGKLETSQWAETLNHLKFLDEDARKDFLIDVEGNRVGLVNMIGELSDWLRIRLEIHPVVSVLGI